MASRTDHWANHWAGVCPWFQRGALTRRTILSRPLEELFLLSRSDGVPRLAPSGMCHYSPTHTSCRVPPQHSPKGHWIPQKYTTCGPSSVTGDSRGLESFSQHFFKNKSWFIIWKCPFRCKTPPSYAWPLSQGTLRCPSAASPSPSIHGWISLSFYFFFNGINNIPANSLSCALCPQLFDYEKKRQIYILLYLLYIPIHKHTRILLSDHLKVRHHDTSS